MTTLQLDKQRGGTIPSYQYFYRNVKRNLFLSCFTK